MLKRIRSYRISIALILLAALAAGPFLSIKADPVRAASRSTNTQAPTGIGNTLCSLSKHGPSPILSPGSPGAWDSGAVWNPAVLKVGTDYKMWYNGGNGTVTSIGYATSRMELPGRNTRSTPSWLRRTTGKGRVYLLRQSCSRAVRTRCGILPGMIMAQYPSGTPRLRTALAGPSRSAIRSYTPGIMVFGTTFRYSTPRS